MCTVFKNFLIHSVKNNVIVLLDSTVCCRQGSSISKVLKDPSLHTPSHHQSSSRYLAPCYFDTRSNGETLTRPTNLYQSLNSLAGSRSLSVSSPTPAVRSNPSPFVPSPTPSPPLTHHPHLPPRPCRQQAPPPRLSPAPAAAHPTHERVGEVSSA